eukprot:780869-Prymnesium_polylepis.1
MELDASREQIQSETTPPAEPPADATHAEAVAAEKAAVEKVAAEKSAAEKAGAEATAVEKAVAEVVAAEVAVAEEEAKKELTNNLSHRDWDKRAGACRICWRLFILNGSQIMLTQFAPCWKMRMKTFAGPRLK